MLNNISPKNLRRSFIGATSFTICALVICGFSGFTLAACMNKNKDWCFMSDSAFEDNKYIFCYLIAAFGLFTTASIYLTCDIKTKQKEIRDNSAEMLSNTVFGGNLNQVLNNNRDRSKSIRGNNNISK